MRVGRTERKVEVVDNDEWETTVRPEGRYQSI
jgi:hypothetical protein